MVTVAMTCRRGGFMFCLFYSIPAHIYIYSKRHASFVLRVRCTCMNEWIHSHRQMGAIAFEFSSFGIYFVMSCPARLDLNLVKVGRWLVWIQSITLHISPIPPTSPYLTFVDPGRVFSVTGGILTRTLTTDPVRFPQVLRTDSSVSNKMSAALVVSV